MKKFVFASLLALGTSTLLAGCGLIPAQTIVNPLGLKDAVLTSSVLSTASSSLSTRVAGTGTANVSAIFEDQTISLPLTPAKVDINLELANATISPACAAAVGLTNLQVTLSNFTVALSDGTGNTARNLSATLPTFSFNVDTNTGAISNLNVASLAFSLPNVGQAIAIITTAPTPNTASINSNIATSPALPGCTISMKIGTSNGILSF